MSAGAVLLASTHLSQSTAPDLILVDGRIYTLDAARPWAEALAVRGDRIVAVGTSADMREVSGPSTRVIDLKGAFVSPGFNDGHVHVESTGALLTGANLLDVHEPKAFRERIAQAAARLPAGSWITRGDWGAYEQWGQRGGTARRRCRERSAHARSPAHRRPDAESSGAGEPLWFPDTTPDGRYVVFQRREDSPH
jgi:predicted amidohydrolase YtcJ